MEGGSDQACAGASQEVEAQGFQAVHNYVVGEWALPEDCEPEEYQNSEQGAEILYFLNFARKAGRFCDVVLKLDDESEIKAHKVVLVASCETLASFLGLITEEVDQDSELALKKIEIKDIPADIMKAIVDYIYTGEVELTRYNVKQILEKATLFQMGHLKMSCFSYIAEGLRPDTVLPILDYTQMMGEEMLQLYLAIKKYCLRFFAIICKHESFYYISEEVLLDLIRDDDLVVVLNQLIPTLAEQEKIIADAVFRYIEHAPEERCQALPAFLHHIRLPCLQYADLDDVEKRAKKLKADKRSMRLIKKAKVALFAMKKQGKEDEGDMVVKSVSSSSSEDEEGDLDAFSREWMRPRAVPEVHILPGAPFGNGETCEVIETFNDGDHCDAFVSGFKIWIEDNSSGPHIAAMLIRYSDGGEERHGTSESEEVHDVTFEADERVVKLIVGSDVTLQSLGLITNLGRQFGPYGREAGADNNMVVESPPEGTWGYLVWVRGEHVKVDGVSGLINIQFFWAHHPVIPESYNPYQDQDGEPSAGCPQQ